MNKTKLVELIRAQLEKDIVVLKEAAIATYKAATDEESKPENEYDTRGLEASYLAGAQAKRVSEIEELLAIYKYLEIKTFGPSDVISNTALVETESNNKTNYFFIMSKGGGMSINLEGRTIQVITPTSPLGEALIGLKEGGVAIVETGATSREYEILSVS